MNSLKYFVFNIQEILFQRKTLIILDDFFKINNTRNDKLFITLRCLSL